MSEEKPMSQVAFHAYASSSSSAEQNWQAVVDAVIAEYKRRGLAKRPDMAKLVVRLRRCGCGNSRCEERRNIADAIESLIAAPPTVEVPEHVETLLKDIDASTGIAAGPSDSATAKLLRRAGATIRRLATTKSPPNNARVVERLSEYRQQMLGDGVDKDDPHVVLIEKAIQALAATPEKPDHADLCGRLRECIKSPLCPSDDLLRECLTALGGEPTPTPGKSAYQRLQDLLPESERVDWNAVHHSVRAAWERLGLERKDGG